jgi:DNA polymerase-3 subunit chi
VTDVKFFHLMRRKTEQALPEIVTKAVERDGLRVVIKTPHADRTAAIDQSLWAEPLSFLPHGTVYDGSETQQPVFITTEDDNPNGATMLVLTDGVESAMVGKYDLCCEVFEDADEAAVTAARTKWKEYKDKGYTLTYFQQDDDGRWTKK